ncbi:RNA-directed DNA polymerase, eukaryota [Tanacetum coccineum]
MSFSEYNIQQCYLEDERSRTTHSPRDVSWVEESAFFGSGAEVNVGGDINSLSAEHVSKEDLMGPIGNTGFASPHITTKNVIDSNFLCAIGSWVGVSYKVGFLNIYGRIALVKSRCSEERTGSNFESNKANVFNDFISRTSLFDFQLGGRRFTRIDKSGYKLSKLDRFLVTQNFFNIWSDVSIKVLSRSFSDHCPLVLTVGLPNFGPKAFKFFDKWIGNPKFQSVVSNLWSSIVYSLTPDLNLKNKIKKLRLDIKKWTSDTLHSQNQVKDNLLSNLCRSLVLDLYSLCKTIINLNKSKSTM